MPIYVPYFCVLRALIIYVPDMASFLCALCALLFWRTLRAFISLRAFSFLSVSYFWRAFMCLHFFIKCGTTQNQPQQAEINKNEAE